MTAKTLKRPKKLYTTVVEYPDWITVSPKDPRDADKIFADFTFNPYSKIVLDMRWLDDVKKNKIFEYEKGKELYLHIDAIGMVRKSTKEEKNCNLMLNKEGYCLRRFRQAYNDEYYWVVEQSRYNDTIYFKQTGATSIFYCHA